jgi:hypothetical protein
VTRSSYSGGAGHVELQDANALHRPHTQPSSAPRAERGGPRRRRRPQGDLQRRPLQRRPWGPDHLGPTRPRPEVLIERLSPIWEAVAQIVYEAGPTGFGLPRRLRAEGYTAQIIAPSKLLTSVGLEAKSDRLDCRRLAQLSAKGLLHPVRVPTEPEEADRQVLRLREQLIRKSRSIQQQIKALLLQHGVAEPDGLTH